MADRDPTVTILPRSAPYLDDAVEAGGGRLGPIEEASALVWTKARAPEELAAVLDDNPDIGWIQLPWAGVEAHLPTIEANRHRLWTNAKGIYADPVAELGLSLLLALFRELTRFVPATTWLKPAGRTLHGARVLLVGGGGIARTFERLLAPFDCEITVVRRHDEPFPGARRVVTADRLHEVLPDVDVVLLALPLLDDTRAMFGEREFALLPEGAVLVNVARGGHVDTDALVDAIRSGHLGGAGLDVTDPEPLPDGHPLWDLPNVIITPHTGNTQKMAEPLLGGLITDNVRRWIAGEELQAAVDPDLGY